MRFLEWKCINMIKISLKFATKGPFNNIPAGQATGHYRGQSWLAYWRTNASHGFNELSKRWLIPGFFNQSYRLAPAMCNTEFEELPWPFPFPHIGYECVRECCRAGRCVQCTCSSTEWHIVSTGDCIPSSRCQTDRYMTCKISQNYTPISTGLATSIAWRHENHELLTGYAKWRVAHAPGMPGTFSLQPTSKETAS